MSATQVAATLAHPASTASWSYLHADEQELLPRSPLTRVWLRALRQDNIVLWIKDWIVEKMGAQVVKQWVDAGLPLTDEMQARIDGSGLSLERLRAAVLRAGSEAAFVSHSNRRDPRAPQ